MPHKLLILGFLLTLVAILPTTAFAIENGVVNLTTDLETSEGVFAVLGEGPKSSDTAYISTDSSVYIYDEINGLNEVTIEHPVHGAPSSITAPMKLNDGRVVVAGDFLNFGTFLIDSALFDLEDGTIIQEWSDTTSNAIDSSGSIVGTHLGTVPARLHVDGTIEQLANPAGFAGGAALDTTINGIAAGRNNRPSSIDGPAVWPDSGTIEFLSDTLDGRVWSVRENNDALINFGAVLEGEAYIQFGGSALQRLLDDNGAPITASRVYVTQNDIAFVLSGSGVWVYWPGITTTKDQAVGISDAFLELDQITVLSVGRPWSGEGKLLVPFDTADGSYLLTTQLPKTRPLLGDVNEDGDVNLLDVAPFVEVLSTGSFHSNADMDQNGVVNLLDVTPFVAALAG